MSIKSESEREVLLVKEFISLSIWAKYPRAGRVSLGVSRTKGAKAGAPSLAALAPVEHPVAHRFLWKDPICSDPQLGVIHTNSAATPTPSLSLHIPLPPAPAPPESKHHLRDNRFWHQKGSEIRFKIPPLPFAVGRTWSSFPPARRGWIRDLIRQQTNADVQD